jgi:hypothetical protein
MYERLLNKRKISKFDSEKIVTIDKTSFDLIGPLYKRSWFNTCFEEYDLSSYYDENCINVILDFVPMGFQYLKNLKYDILWYDLIDNFEKHNRFSLKEKSFVAKKYKWINGNANIITGVSEKCLEKFNKSIIMPNAAGVIPWESSVSVDTPPIYDFGFIGFITDKFDVEFVRILSDLGYKIAIYGEFYDKGLRKKFNSIPNLYIHGAFRHYEIPQIINTFKVGIIPYIQSKLHDESPLKLYQYILHNRPVVTSVNFEIKSEAVTCYQGLNLLEISNLLVEKIHYFEINKNSSKIKEILSEDDYWIGKLEKIFRKIDDLKL